MKIKVNYDLFEKMALGRRGYTLKMCVLPSVFYDCIFTTVNYLAGDSPEELLTYFISYFAVSTTLNVVLCKTIWGTDEKKEFHLSRLQKDLRTINVSTSRENLLNSYKYKTEYKIGTYKSFAPQIIQKKYIMVPLSEEDEESILQEHIIGTNEYELSKDEPKKEYKLSFKRAVGTA